ncbi:MAG: class II fructose-1,6-bisphosphate aldolase [bacterium]|nr:class II fructose-1,6-bisphosphate aldolase [bacterium]
MTLVSSKQILLDAYHNHYAVGAFNCNNMEIVQGIIAAAAQERAPVIIQASQGALKYAGLEYIVALIRTAAAEYPEVPLVMHLDHGTDFAQVLACMEAGFTSVMIDASKLPMAENIDLTRKIVEIAHPKGISVEAEIGKIGGTEDQVSVSEKEAAYTDPQEAVEFVRATGCDSLAVAVGTAHGQYVGPVKLNYDLLEQIHQQVEIPIVLHGSSGVPAEMLREAITRGVSKVNIDTDLRAAFVNKIHQVLQENPDEIDPRLVLGPARAALQEVVAEKIRIFGSNDKI